MKILLFGEPVNFREKVKYTTIDRITNDVLTTGYDNYERVALIINDRNGTLTLSDDDLETISGAVSKGEIDLYYFGKKNRDKLISTGISSNDVSIAGTEDLSLVVALSENRMITILGAWTDEEERISLSNEELFGQIIILHIANNIKSNN